MLHCIVIITNTEIPFGSFCSLCELQQQGKDLLQVQLCQFLLHRTACQGTCELGVELVAHRYCRWCLVEYTLDPSAFLSPVLLSPHLICTATCDGPGSLRKFLRKFYLFIITNFPSPVQSQHIALVHFPILLLSGQSFWSRKVKWLVTNILRRQKDCPSGGIEKRTIRHPRLCHGIELL